MADIRSFFASAASKKRKSSGESDKPAKKAQVIESDGSDEEAESAPKPAISPPPTPPAKVKKENTISAADFFGNSSPKRKKVQFSKETNNDSDEVRDKAHLVHRFTDIKDISQKSEVDEVDEISILKEKNGNEIMKGFTIPKKVKLESEKLKENSDIMKESIPKKVKRDSEKLKEKSDTMKESTPKKVKRDSDKLRDKSDTMKESTSKKVKRDSEKPKEKSDTMEESTSKKVKHDSEKPKEKSDTKKESTSKKVKRDSEKPKEKSDTMKESTSKKVKRDSEKPKEKSDTMKESTSKKVKGDPMEQSKVKSPSKEDNDNYEDMVNSTMDTSVMSRRDAFEAFMNREGPMALGSRPRPKGAKDCLARKTFVTTGVYETLTREDIEQIVMEHGGRITKACSGKTTYLCVGRESGLSKIAKAKKLNIKMLSEDDFYFLLTGVKPKPIDLNALDEEEDNNHEPINNEQPDEPMDNEPTKQSQSESEVSAEKSSLKPAQSQAAAETKRKATASDLDINDTGMWADRYSPQSLKKLIGQSSPGSNANILLKWINEFSSKRKNPLFKRAVLLSGPPGIGKTTMAQLVCKEAGFNWIEMNASDVRTKNKLKEHVSMCADNTTITGFYESEGKKKIKKDCILMDEVDGMSGNADRGGIQELISIIKDTKIPIICMCNDRQANSMRTLVKYTLDIRVNHPRLEQIKGAMRTVAYKEGLKIETLALESIILSANYDMRQIWNNLSMWSASEKLTTEGIIRDAKASKKSTNLGPYEATKILFKKWKTDENDLVDRDSLEEKFDMYSCDSQLVPLFVQNNYLRTRNTVSKRQKMMMAAEASDWLSMGDITNTAIYSKQRFALIPTQILFSCVVPGQIMAGEDVRVDFPRVLGHMSTLKKAKAQYLDIVSHMSRSSSSGTRDLVLNVAPSLRTMLMSPLSTDGLDGIDSVIALMNAYDLSREDYDIITELTRLNKSTVYNIETKVKSTFTRRFNKETHMLPYSNIDLTKIKPSKKATKKAPRTVKPKEPKDKKSRAPKKTSK